MRDALLAALLHGAADLVVLPLQDVFGWPDRINVPATVADTNWTWRLPWPIDRMAMHPAARERAGALARWIRESRRD
ncbi:MAG: 4-alpha-glucanotransferase [Vicinamibacteria bacterium]